MGYYAPYTMTGTYVANGVVTSCHSLIKQHALLHTLMHYANRFFWWPLSSSQDAASDRVELPILIEKAADYITELLPNFSF